MARTPLNHLQAIQQMLGVMAGSQDLVWLTHAKPAVVRR